MSFPTPESLRAKALAVEAKRQRDKDEWLQKLMANIYQLMERAAADGLYRIKLEPHFTGGLGSESPYQYRLTEAIMDSVVARLKSENFVIQGLPNKNEYVVIWE